MSETSGVQISTGSSVGAPTVCFSLRKLRARLLRRDKLDIVGLPLSLKTVHCTVFAFGTLAFESLSALYTKNKNHPVGGFVRQRNKGKVSARYLRRVELDIVGLPLSLKTVHCTVFAFGMLAFESLPALYTKNKNHPCGWFCFWCANRDSNPGPTGYEPVALTN